MPRPNMASWRHLIRETVCQDVGCFILLENKWNGSFSFGENFAKHATFFLPAPNEVICASAYEEGGPETRGHSNGEMFVFPVEIVDPLDSYNNVTGNKKAVRLICYCKHTDNYCPKTKIAKVMFSQVFVCPKVGVSAQGLSLSRRVSVQGVSVRETPQYGKEQVVCILLECILVSMHFLIIRNTTKSQRKILQ